MADKPKKTALVDFRLLAGLIALPLPSGLTFHGRDKDGCFCDFDLRAGWVVIKMMPGPSQPDVTVLPRGYMDVEGAPGCTTACTGLNVLCPGFPTEGTKLVVVTSQPVEVQAAVAELRGWRNLLLLSDPAHELALHLGLPRLILGGERRTDGTHEPTVVYPPRVTLICRDGIILHAHSMLPAHEDDALSDRLVRLMADEREVEARAAEHGS